LIGAWRFVMLPVTDDQIFESNSKKSIFKRRRRRSADRGRSLLRLTGGRVRRLRPAPTRGAAAAVADKPPGGGDARLMSALPSLAGFTAWCVFGTICEPTKEDSA
jgi:hypothetical protein